MYKNIKTLRELLYWSYANLAMVHNAVERKLNKYDIQSYKIRAKLYKGLMNETLNIRSFFSDKKLELKIGQQCYYCGNVDHLSIDHLFPKKYKGTDAGENLVYSCRSCNSSKGEKDLFEWLNSQNNILSVLIIRRYLKLIINYCKKHNILDKNINEIQSLQLPFKIKYIPIKFNIDMIKIF